MQVKVWFQNRRMKWRHQESKERREGRDGAEGTGWGVSTNVMDEEEEFRSEGEEDDDDEEGVSPAVADSTVDTHNVIG